MRHEVSSGGDFSHPKLGSCHFASEFTEVDPSLLATTVHALQALVEAAAGAAGIDHKMCRALKVLHDMCRFAHLDKREMLDEEVVRLLPGYIKHDGGYGVGAHSMMLIDSNPQHCRIILQTLVFSSPFSLVPRIDPIILDLVERMMPPAPRFDRKAEYFSADAPGAGSQFGYDPSVMI